MNTSQPKRAPKKAAVAKKAPAKKAATRKASEPEVEERIAPSRWLSGRRLTGLRDLILFLSGLGGVFYETVFTKADRPTLLLLFAAMMGLPAFLRTDEHRR